MRLSIIAAKSQKINTFFQNFYCLRYLFPGNSIKNPLSPLCVAVFGGNVPRPQTGCGLSSPFFLPFFSTLRKIPTEEKAGKKSKIPENNYVNLFAYPHTVLHFSPPVEKPVESVEKYLFSTPIHRFSTFRAFA